MCYSGKKLVRGGGVKNYSGAEGSCTKWVFFARFREYFLIGVSYGSDFFTGVKNNVRRTF